MELNPSMVSFHPFLFDLETGCLSIRGKKIHIPEQNARLLGYLIQKSGQLATHEELQTFLWPESPPYDSRQAINKAISQLRTALNDSSTKSESRYIETLPRRGYRFCADFRYIPPAKIATLHASLGAMSIHAAPEDTDTETAVFRPPPPALVATELEFKPEHSSRPEGSLPIRTLFPALLLPILGIAVFFGWTRFPRPLSPLPVVFRTLAIPPLEAVGADAETIAEPFRLDLTESLAQLPQVKVLSAHAFTSSPRDKNNVSQLSRSQGADLLLPGRFEVRGGRCYLQFELVRNSDSSHVASFHYEGNLEQLPGLLTKIQEDVFAKLKLTSNDSMPKKTTAIPEAYQAYVQGRHFLTRRTDEDLNQAIAQFKLAIDLDAKFAKAYSGLASAYMILASHRSFPDGYQMSRELAMHALQLDDSLAESHALLGCIAMSKDWDRDTSKAELLRAIELDPDEASFHIWLATTYNIEGHFKESLQQIDLAKQEDPYWPPVYQSEVLAAANAGEKQRTLASAKTLLQLTPSWSMAHNTVGSALWAIGHYPEAIAEWRTMYALDNDQQGIRLEEDGLKALRSSGPAAYAALHLANAKLVAGTDEAFAPLAVAEWAAEAGDRAAALSMIQSMISHGDSAAVTIGIDPAFASLREDPHFEKMLVSAGLDFRH